MAAARTRARRSRRNRPSPAFSWVLGAILVLAVVAVGALVWSRTGGGRAALLNLGAENLYGDVQERLDAALARSISGFVPGDVVAAGEPDAHDWPLTVAGDDAAVRCRVVPVAASAAWWQVQERFERAVSGAGGRLLWAERIPRSQGRQDQTEPDEHRDLLRLDVGVAAHPTHTLLLYREDLPRPEVRWGGDPAAGAWQRLRAGATGPVVAVVIDDCGYRRDAATDGLLALDVPLTLSVLPGLAYSRHFSLLSTDLALPVTTLGGADQAARRRRAAGCPVSLGLGPAPARLEAHRREIFLHLPMQPQAYPDLDPGPNAVMVGMARDRMAELVDEALAAMPTIRGVNNHMGSAATSDLATMDDFMAVLRERDLIFLDSLTTARSVAYDAARRAGVPAARNRVFLDHDHQDPERVRERLRALVRAARATGFAVGIGHPKPVTLAVLREELPRLQAEGVVFVTVSELVALRGLVEVREGA